MMSAQIQPFKSLVRRFSLVHSKSKPNDRYDAVVIGAGHNGLVAAAYLAKEGKSVCCLERRHVVGGAAVTEEIVPGFRFSRASYLLSLFRPRIIEELKLKEHGLRYKLKEPASFTPMRNSKEFLILGSDMEENQRQIGKFSTNDAKAYPEYEDTLNRVVRLIEPLLDEEPPQTSSIRSPKQLANAFRLAKLGYDLGWTDGLELYELMTAPISKVMNRWFESEPLKATIATDGIVGFMASPNNCGTGYVLLHHVLGGLGERQGAWAFAIGGMGAVSDAIAKSAESHGAEIFTEAEVDSIMVDSEGAASGVKLCSGQEIYADAIFSNATPHVTFRKLLDESLLPKDFLNAVNNIDYTSPVTKINVAVNALPNFACLPNQSSAPMPHHGTTIHLNCESMQLLHDAFLDCQNGSWSKKPVVEMTIPSSVDDSISPPGSHVVLLFTQFTPYNIDGQSWTEQQENDYAKHLFGQIDEYCPGFSSSVVGFEVLTPPKLENIFGLTGGNIFHGAMSLDQLYWSRPVRNFVNYRMPIKGLYLCGSGAHPGGGVTGSPGRLAALAMLAQT